MKEYNGKNWYWIVADDQTKVFSSAIGDYVPFSDPAFVAWSKDETVPTRIESEASLGAVLASLGVRPVNAGALLGYQSEQAAGLLQNVAFKILFNHENRLRTLEGKAAVNSAQFITAIKALM